MNRIPRLVQIELQERAALLLLIYESLELRSGIASEAQVQRAAVLLVKDQCVAHQRSDFGEAGLHCSAIERAGDRRGGWSVQITHDAVIAPAET
jgi:hypothetical protein